MVFLSWKCSHVVMSYSLFTCVWRLNVWKVTYVLVTCKKYRKGSNISNLKWYYRSLHLVVVMVITLFLSKISETWSLLRESVCNYCWDLFWFISVLVCGLSSIYYKPFCVFLQDFGWYLHRHTKREQKFTRQLEYGL